MTRAMGTLSVQSLRSIVVSTAKLGSTTISRAPGKDSTSAICWWNDRTAVAANLPITIRAGECCLALVSGGEIRVDRAILRAIVTAGAEVRAAPPPLPQLKVRPEHESGGFELHVLVPRFHDPLLQVNVADPSESLL